MVSVAGVESERRHNAPPLQSLWPLAGMISSSASPMIAFLPLFFPGQHFNPVLFIAFWFKILLVFLS